MGFTWETGATAAVPAAPAADLGLRERARALAGRVPFAELWALLVVTAALNLWDLSRNRWANVYYSAAVRSMSASWHDFLYASLDRNGVMTVDKPPLALWLQALSVRVFGYHPLSILVPQALIGIATVTLVYDLVRRRFGRAAGFVAGLALALTPITVAISRHNNPDALLVLCCVGAVWCALRALEHGRTRWLLAAGVCVGLGFETKMLVALVVVPGIVAAWLWLVPAARGRLHAAGQLLWAGAVMVLIGGVWPALVELTPAADRPWISGTADNRIVSLIFGYNGLGRVAGQAGGPGGPAGAGNVFGGSAGPLRLLNAALGGQASWLLGFALVATLALLAACRLRRSDARTGWLIAVGGAFATTALLFSFASGIFHPYYVSLLAPFVAALVGAGAGSLLRGGDGWRLAGALAVAAGVVVELVVRADYPEQLVWLPPLLVVAAIASVLALLALRSRRARVLAVTGALAALLLAPATWALDTLGYATSSTFPGGGPQSASAIGPGGSAGGTRRFGTGPFGAGSLPASGPPAGTFFGGGGGQGAPFAGGGPPAGIGGGAAPGFGGGASLKEALAYIAENGGGGLAVSSQSSAASAIIESGADVAGIGGFSGRESDVSITWLAQEVGAGKIRWVLDEEAAVASPSTAFGFEAPGAGGPAVEAARGLLGGAGGVPGGTGARRETRLGSKPAMAAVTRACRAVALPEGSTTRGTLYECAGRASALAAA